MGAWRRSITNPVSSVAHPDRTTAHYCDPVAPSPAPSWLARAALICWLAAAAALACEDVSAVRPVVRAISPLRRGLGISQSWSMFAPNPPTATYWLEVEGRHGVRWSLLEQPGSTPLSVDVRWRYARASKFGRGLVATTAKRERTWLGRWWCAQDPDLAAVRFLHARLPSGPVGTPVSTGPIQRSPLGVHRCR